jgi:phycocyanin-associated rod linker protein
MYRLRVIRAGSANSAVVRRSMAELLVSYDQLTNKLQQLNRSGNKVISVTSVWSERSSCSWQVWKLGS